MFFWSPLLLAWYTNCHILKATKFPTGVVPNFPPRISNFPISKFNSNSFLEMFCREGWFLLFIFWLANHKRQSDFASLWAISSSPDWYVQNEEIKGDCFVAFSTKHHKTNGSIHDDPQRNLKHAYRWKVENVNVLCEGFFVELYWSVSGFMMLSSSSGRNKTTIFFFVFPSVGLLRKPYPEFQKSWVKSLQLFSGRVCCTT